jgi:hypothetical protein
MKKLIGLFVISCFLIIPFSAGATIINNVELYMTAADYTTLEKESFQGHTPIGGNSLDYNVNLTKSSSIVNSSEAFCVEDIGMITGSSLYTLISLDMLTDSAKYEFAAKIAETYYATKKDAAQIAVWETIFDYGTSTFPDLTKGTFRASGIFNADAESMLIASLNNTNAWMLAISPADGYTITSDGKVDVKIGLRGQNYLVHVPEPTQMLLLGTALIGLAGIGRKKFFKK